MGKRSPGCTLNWRGAQETPQGQHRWQRLAAGTAGKSRRHVRKQNQMMRGRRISFVRLAAAICPESTAEYSTKCAIMFSWLRLLCLTVPLVLGITSQWLSVHNVGIVNYKLQKPDINLALLGLSSQNLPCLKSFEGWRKKWTAGSVKCRSGGLMCSGMFTRAHWFCSGLISVIEMGDLYSLV